MPAKFNFAVFLERPARVAPSLVFQAAEKVFQERLGNPQTTMQLNVKNGTQTDRAWQMAETNVPSAIAPQELFFVYYAAATDSSKRGPIISFCCPPNCAIVTITLEDTSIEADARSIVRLCTALYHTFQPFAECCILTAGEEVTIDAYSATEALQKFAAFGSLSQWAGGNDDDAQFLLSTGQFSTELQTPEFVLLGVAPSSGKPCGIAPAGFFDFSSARGRASSQSTHRHGPAPTGPSFAVIV